jgi:hypothetical protein
MYIYAYKSGMSIGIKAINARHIGLVESGIGSGKISNPLWSGRMDKI